MVNQLRSLNDGQFTCLEMRLISGIFVWKKGCLGNSYTGFIGLSAGTVIKKEIKEPNVKVLLGALLFGCNVSSIVRNLCVFRTKNTWEGERKPAKILKL